MWLRNKQHKFLYRRRPELNTTCQLSLISVLICSKTFLVAVSFREVIGLTSPVELDSTMSEIDYHD